MATIGLSVGIFAAAMSMMAVGVIFSDRLLKGSCGGDSEDCVCSIEKRRACHALAKMGKGPLAAASHDDPEPPGMPGIFQGDADLVRRGSYVTDLGVEEVHRRLFTYVEPSDEGFPLVSRLSGAGVVIQVMRTPVTVRPFFGVVKEGRFHITLVPTDENLTPWRPIVHGIVAEGPEGHGALLELELRPHGNARSFAGVYAVVGGILLLGAFIKATANPAFALVAGILALLFLTFPKFRAKWSFERDCDLALARVARELDLRSLDDDPAVPSVTSQSHSAAPTEADDL